MCVCGQGQSSLPAQTWPFPADFPQGDAEAIGADAELLSSPLFAGEHVLRAAAPVCHQDLVPAPVGG